MGKVETKMYVLLNARRKTVEQFTWKHIHVLKLPSQSPDLKGIKKLWQSLEMAFHKRSQSNLNELEIFYNNRQENSPNSLSHKKKPFEGL